MVDGCCCAARLAVVVGSIEEVDGCAGTSDGWGAVATEGEGTTSAGFGGGGACLIERVTRFLAIVKYLACRFMPRCAWRKGYGVWGYRHFFLTLSLLSSLLWDAGYEASD